jgi:hypothetical protein
LGATICPYSISRDSVAGAEACEPSATDERRSAAERRTRSAIPEISADGLTRRGFGWVVAAAAVGLAGCDTPTRRFRERLTLVVDTPEGTATGTSVIEHATAFQDGWLGGIANHTLLGSTRGEATVVDLRSHGLLFALLTPDMARIDRNGRRGRGAPGGYEYSVFKDLNDQATQESGGKTEKLISLFIDSLNRLKPKGEVPFDILGLFVRFRDPNDSRTVERVDPANFAASYGHGLRLNSATIEITDDPLTTGIEQKLPWLKDGWPEKVLIPYSGPLRPASQVSQIENLTHDDFWSLMQ